MALPRSHKAHRLRGGPRAQGHCRGGQAPHCPGAPRLNAGSAHALGEVGPGCQDGAGSRPPAPPGNLRRWAPACRGPSAASRRAPGPREHGHGRARPARARRARVPAPAPAPPASPGSCGRREAGRGSCACALVPVPASPARSPRDLRPCPRWRLRQGLASPLPQPAGLCAPSEREPAA